MSGPLPPRGSRVRPDLEGRTQSQDGRVSSPKTPPSTGQDSGAVKVLPACETQMGRTVSSYLLELGFVVAIVLSQLITEYFVSGFLILVPRLSRELGAPHAATFWPTNVYSLTVACFMIPFGRLADRYGGFYFYTGGLVWFCILTCVAAFSPTIVVLVALRALQGLGPAAFLPSGVKLIFSLYGRGRRRNVFLSVYWACVPLGFFAGNLSATAASESTTWKWYFWVGAILTGFTLCVTIVAVPPDSGCSDRRMDWPGGVSLVGSLMLLGFSITNSSQERWKRPDIFVPFVCGVLFLILTVCIEVKVNKPLIPSSCLRNTMLPWVFTILFLSNGAFGIYLVYSTLWFQDSLGVAPMTAALSFSPLVVGAFIVSATTGVLLEYVSGTSLMVTSGIAAIVPPIILLVRLDKASYWAFILLAMICGAVGFEVSFSVMSVFTMSQFPQGHGFAGALVNFWLAFPVAIFPGFADVLVSCSSQASAEPNYKPVFCFELVLATASLLLIFAKLRVGKFENGRNDESFRIL